MLKKLLKYDLLSYGKSLLPLYILLIATSLLNRLFIFIGDKIKLLSFLSSMFSILFILFVIGTFFYTFIIAVKKFYQGLLKDEGYLTHTLPVSLNKIVLSKVLVSLIYYIFSIMIIIIALLITFYTKGSLTNLFNSLQPIITSVGLKPGSVYIGIGYYLISTYLVYILLIYFALALGQTRNSNRIVYSIAFGFIVNMISQVVSSIGVGILYVINPSIMNELEQETLNTGAFTSLMIMSFIITILYMVGYYYGTVKVLDKKLNLE